MQRMSSEEDQEVFEITDFTTASDWERMYAIVKFVNENDAPGIVCCHWINKDENICQYPNVRTNEARNKLLQNSAQPNQDWFSCSIKVLQKFSNFKEAVSYLEKLEKNSNLDSNDKALNKPRKKFKKNPKEKSDEDYETILPEKLEISIDPFPIPYNNLNSKGQSSMSYISPNNIETHANDTYDATAPSEKPQSSSSSPSNLEKSPECSSSQTVINGMMVSWMSDISYQVQQLGDKIDMVLKNQAKLLQQKPQVSESLDREEDLEILGSFPVTDDSRFGEINNKITEESHLKHLFVKFLISVGGKDMRCHIHNMLKRILSDEVAELYTLSGKSTIKSTTKKPFLSTEVSKSMYSACQRVFKDMVTEVKFKEAVGDWLSQAKVRKIRRLQRREKKLTEECG